MKFMVMSDESAVSMAPIKCVEWGLEGILRDGIILEKDSDSLRVRRTVPVGEK